MSPEDSPTISDSQFEVSLGAVGPGSVVFGRYKLERELGRGGMGVVWLAQDERVDVAVALKFLPDVVARDAESVDELKRELRRGLNLTHPGIVRVYSFEQDASGAAIAMEYVDGPTLSSLKTKQDAQCFDVEELAPLLEQLCAALDYAHFEAKIVHRDLKPRNLMLTSKGRLKIADFGVATSISDTVSRATMRRDGSGTPPYMSPQQAFGENPSPGDDIYSVGATLYELLTGRPPFYQGNILAQVQQRVPPSMSERREVLKVTKKKPIPSEWEETIAACLAKLVEDRPARAGDLIAMLRGQMKAPHRHTESGPINPALTRTPQKPANKPTGNDDDEETDPAEGVVREDTTARGPAAPPPPLPKKGSSAGSLVLLMLLIAAGVGIVWWQKQEQKKVEQSIREVQSQIPVAPTPDPEAARAKAQQEEAAQAAKVAADEKAEKEKKMREADEAAAAAGKIPKAGAAWTNSLQMKFVPVAGMSGLFSIYETRYEDYRVFASEKKRPWTPTEFIQGEDHPAVNVSWIDAVSFCEWLTKKERAEGTLSATQRYRLLNDAEWSWTVGVRKEEGETPAEKDRKVTELFPWGMEPVPTNPVENLAGEGETNLPEKELLGYHDGFSHTAPVGRFLASPAGLFDLGGNVSEWVEDWFDATNTDRTIRGAAYLYIAPYDRCVTFRWHLAPDDLTDWLGFRVMIDFGK
jgi:serine/threonine protein kinase/formylglycine-generating enzyme required for sulfatase activity